MVVAGIIAEYNPFHNGHAHHISRTRDLTGAEAVVAVMSGNFVQRGDFALLDKWTRAESAVRCGVDLVLELPVVYAVSSARRFAAAGVRILNALNVVTHLSFGSESGSIEPLRRAALLLQSDVLEAGIKQELEQGISYPSARQKAFEHEFGTELSGLLESPNNILAIEYLRALVEQGSAMRPVTVERRGAAHDQRVYGGEYASASALRELMLGGRDKEAAAHIPEQSYNLLLREIAKGFGPVSLRGIERVMLSDLRRMSETYISALPDVSEGLERRIAQEIAMAVNMTQLYERIKTKRYAMSRIRRVLMCAFLRITKSLSETSPQYIRVLAANETGRRVLALARGKSTLPIAVKPAGIPALGADAAALFATECTATDQYMLAAPVARRAGMEYRSSPYMEK